MDTYNKSRDKVVRTYRETEFPYIEEFFDSDSTIDELNQIIMDNKESSGGNYDGFIGFCKNFEYKIREDGGYDCTTEVIAMGEVLDGLKGVNGQEPYHSKYLRNNDKFTDARFNKTRKKDGSSYKEWDLDNPGLIKITELEFWLYSMKNIWTNFHALNELESNDYYDIRYTATRQMMKSASDKQNKFMHSVAPFSFLINYLIDLVIKIWDDEHKNIAPGGPEDPNSGPRYGHELYNYPGVTDWNSLSTKEKHNLAHSWLATCGFLFMEAETEYESEPTGEDDDPATEDVDESVERKYYKTNIMRSFVRWDLFCEILNHFVI